MKIKQHVSVASNAFKFSQIKTIYVPLILLGDLTFIVIPTNAHVSCTKLILKLL